MKEITFIPLSKEIELLVPPPKPAKFFMPEWYKKEPRFKDGKLKIDTDKNGKITTGSTFKGCMPFMDSFLTGYIQETWCDIHIETYEDKLFYKWSGSPEIINCRENVSSKDMIDSSLIQAEMIWHQPWVPILPSGYSMIYTHPFNRFDLPFITTTGIIDNDVYYHESAANYPFFLKNGFSGIIPCGTPMYQMIPVKRDHWKMDTKKYDEDTPILSNVMNKFFIDSYKKMFWNKKQYD